MPNLPNRDRFGYPDATAKVSCTFGAARDLTLCTSDLPNDDERGNALSVYVSRWKVLTDHVGQCPVRGRRFSVTFQLVEATDGEGVIPPQRAD
jgi:hypothetical protein